MEYILMHKEIPVTKLIIDEMGYIVSLKEVYNIEHIPVGIRIVNDIPDKFELNKWWTSRSIPASRQGIRGVLETLDYSETSELLNKAYGLSLSDGYWIKPIDSNLDWNEINFFNNDFSEDMGDVLFGNAKQIDNISLVSPDNTSGGWLKKKWKIINEKRYLIKGGSGYWQEPYNEVIATIICQRLGISHVAYNLMTINEYPYSSCENFITEETEFISAYDLMKNVKKSNNISLYKHYINVAKENGIFDIEERINEMLILDYILGNEDRHQGNFGVIRNSNTLEYISAAPIFDTGNSLWFDKPVPMIKKETELKARPFKATQDEQIKLVTSFKCFNIESFKGIEDEITKVFSNSLFIDEKRVSVILLALNERILKLKEISESFKVCDDITKDLKEDIRYNGSNINE